MKNLLFHVYDYDVLVFVNIYCFAENKNLFVLYGNCILVFIQCRICIGELDDAKSKNSIACREVAFIVRHYHTVVRSIYTPTILKAIYVYTYIDGYTIRNKYILNIEKNGKTLRTT